MVGNLSVYSGQFMPTMVQNKIASIGLNPAGAADFTSAAAFPITGGAVVTFGTLPLALAQAGREEDLDRPARHRRGRGPEVVRQQALKTVNQTIVNDVPVPTGAPDMSSYVAAATANGTDGVVVGLAGQDALELRDRGAPVRPEV